MDQVQVRVEGGTEGHSSPISNFHTSGHVRKVADREKVPTISNVTITQHISSLRLNVLAPTRVSLQHSHSSHTLLCHLIKLGLLTRLFQFLHSGFIKARLNRGKSATRQQGMYQLQSERRITSPCPVEKLPVTSHAPRAAALSNPDWRK